MDISSAILIIGLAALVSAFLLLVIGLVYSELMNTDMPRGIASSWKLHIVHGLFVGTAVVVSIYSIYRMVYVSCMFRCNSLSLNECFPHM